ncbi:hypothetical protein UFOVP456_21 [uncultured Caudovirales phage]|jgi:hypothetical protein|uniref:Uncharacterized protein n=1 Tax=uncultured Caudovirales phage TaxID=2100421 RepID=A0A6J5MFK0_9CAUD|nr:hypothetical protein UFOVP456_21 [uncultured Caudovirales phage]
MSAQTYNPKMASMYGCDINAFVDNVKESITYRLQGAHMVVAGLMSDAQEMMAYGDTESARQTLNQAKHILFLVMDGELVGTVDRVAA